MNRKGCFVISLDFEMMWGCHDWATADGYGKSNVKHVRSVIERLIDLFDRYSIHATVAFVGLLLNENLNEVIDNKPEICPSYTNKTLDPLRDDFLKDITIDNYDLFFARDIILQLKRHKTIELASHTYGHYNCWAQGQTLDDFCVDMQQMDRVAKDNGISLTTIVFPKNEVSEVYLAACGEMGYTAYRGNPTHLYGKGGYFKSVLNRTLRLVDSYLPISCNSVSFNDIVEVGGMVNIQASRFLRPYNSRIAFLDRLKLLRIKGEMENAAKRGEMYHLWWHPHNFGANMEENFEFLIKVLEEYKYCKERFGMESYNMGEFAIHWKQKEY